MDFWHFVKKFDWVLLIIVLAIIAFSFATIYHGGDKSGQFMKKQIIAVIAGLAVFFVVSAFDYRVFKNYSSASILLYAGSIFLLILTLGFPAVRGSRSWIDIGRFGFQPSEFAKLAIVILLAKYFSQKHAEIYRAHHILASGIYAALPAGLTLLQPDFGSTMIFVALWIGMLLFSGIQRRHLLVIMMTGLIIFSMAWFLAFKPYQKARVISFINPLLDPQGIGYNSIQSRMTFGSGGMFGTIFTPSKRSLPVLVPEQYTDFAFAAFGQRFGFVGVIVLFGLLIALMIRIGSIALRTTNNFSKLFSLGLITLIAVHSLMNAGMNLGLLPITGIPFSFLSYGGSHLVTLMAGLGIVESIRLRG